MVQIAIPRQYKEFDPGGSLPTIYSAVPTEVTPEQKTAIEAAAYATGLRGLYIVEWGEGPLESPNINATRQWVVDYVAENGGVGGGGGDGTVIAVNDVEPDGFGVVTLDLDDIGDGSTNVAFTTTLRTKLTGVVDILANVRSVAGKTGAVTLAKGDVGLGNVDNTSDLNKPISTATTAALGNKADLVGGVLPTAQLPPLAILDTFVVASQVAMLALTAQTGDVAVRTDQNKTYRLTASPASTLANWQEMPAAGAVSSVAGKTGTVVLAAADIASGQFATARLGAGTANATAWLLGDGNWTQMPALASQAEAEAGSVTTERRFTPQRVSQAIAALAPVKAVDINSAPIVLVWDTVQNRVEDLAGNAVASRPAGSRPVQLLGGGVADRPAWLNVNGDYHVVTEFP